MEYKKSDLTRFAKDCAWGAKRLIDGACMSEEIVRSDLGRTIAHGFEEDNEELILEISKRFAKVANDRMVPDVDVGEVQDFCNIIQYLINCCNKNDWFGT